VWFGAAFFMICGAEPAAVSHEMRDLLGKQNFPYFSIAVSHVLIGRFMQVYLLCSIVALLHLVGEWLYLGKYPHRFWVGLLLCLGLIGVGQSYWLLPRLQSWHYLKFSPQSRNQPVERMYRYGHTIFESLNLLALGGLALYLWRVANPPNPARFVSATKFRG
jgi:hypothetical protein